jgi:hypothetical protein
VKNTLAFDERSLIMDVISFITMGKGSPYVSTMISMMASAVIYDRKLFRGSARN